MSNQKDTKYLVMCPMYSRIAIPFKDAPKLLEVLQNALAIDDNTLTPIPDRVITFELSSKLALKTKELEQLATS